MHTPLLSQWLAQAIGQPLPEEPRSTCNDCALCPGKTRPSVLDTVFNPSTKCCTFIPTLANWNVGRILADPNADHGPVLERIATKIGVSPAGVERTPQQALLHRSGKAGFGKALSLRCPHYQEEGGGRCGIWAHREATCTTWFCKHSRGALGYRFWRDVQRVLTVMERGLTRACLLELGATPAALRAILPQAQETLDAAVLDGQMDAKQYTALWGIWEGRELQWYDACRHYVEGLSWTDVQHHCGSDLGVALQLLALSKAQLQETTLPEHLRPGTWTTTPVGPGISRLRTYRPTDPMDLPDAIIEALGSFNGRRTSDVIQSLAEDGLKMNERAIRSLMDWELLVKA